MARKRQFTLTLILILFALFLIAQQCSTAITFDSAPQGADVYIDGELKGQTPVSVLLATGPYNIKYSLEGYQDLVFDLSVTLGMKEVKKTLVPLAAGCPDADADGYCGMPSGANILIGFDDGNAPFHDITAGNDAAICTEWCPAVVPGKVGNAVQFDGTNYLSISDSDDLTLSGDFTISMWIKTSMPKLSSYLHSVVTNWQVDTQQPFWAIEAANGRLSYRTRADDGTWNGDGTGDVISDGNWHHFALTRSADTWKFYIDGELNRISPVKSSSAINPALETRIGQSVDGGYGFNGFIDQLSIFNRALSELEIKEISLQQSPYDDCDDSNNAIYPGALGECFDGLDNNCNGNLDCMDSQCSAKPECICSESGDVRCYQNLAQFCGQGLWATLDLCSENEDCYLIEPSQLEILPGVPVGIGSIAGCSDKVSLSANGAGNDLGGVNYVSGTPLGDPSCFTIGEEYVSYSDTCPPLTGEYHVTMQSQTERTEPPPIIVNHGGGWEVCEECTILSTTQDSFTFQVSGFSKWSTPTRRSCESGTDATCSCAKNDVGCENGVATKVSDIKKELIRSSTIDFYRCTFLQSTRNCDSDETCGSGDCVCDPAKACPADCSGECVDTNGNECLDKCNECISCDSDPDPCPNQKCTPVSACDVECEPCPVCSPSECGVNQGCTGEDADGCSVCGPCPTGVCGGCSPDKCFDQNGDGCKDTCCPRVPCGNPGNKFCCFDPALPKCDMTLSTPACVPNCEAGDTSCTDMCCSTPTRWGCDIRGWDRCSPCDSEFGWQCEPPNRCCTGVTDSWGGWCCDPDVDSCRDGTYGPKCKWTG